MQGKHLNEWLKSVACNLCIIAIYLISRESGDVLIYILLMHMNAEGKYFLPSNATFQQLRVLHILVAALYGRNAQSSAPGYSHRGDLLVLQG